MDITPYFVEIRDKNALLAMYMPYVKNGGLFLKGVQLKMGSPVGMLTSLLTENALYSIDGSVIYVQAQGPNVGVGIQFDDAPTAQALKKRIDELLTGLDRSKNPTFTV